MKMTTQLSVSSVILAAVLSGCSQQQVIGGSQLSSGSQSAGSQQQVKAAAPADITPKAVLPQRAKQPHSVKHSNMALPPAKPGQCFAKVKVPANYQTKSKRVLIQEASSQRVLVRAPQYRWINKKVLVKKATYKNRVIPAQYRNTTKRVLVKPAYNKWIKGYGPITRIDNMTGEIMCRVTVPAVYKNVSQRVLIRKAQTIRTFVPAVYKTVKQKQRVSAAIYKTVKHPARYKTQNYRVKVASARYVWRPILCKTNAPKNYGKSVVRPAKDKKHYKRPSSGITNQEYMQVMNTMKEMSAPKKAIVKKAVKAAPTKGITHQQYMNVMNAPMKKMSAPKKAAVKKAVKAAPTKGITHQQYMQVMNAPMKKMSAPKKAAVKKAVKAEPAKKAEMINKAPKIKTEVIATPKVKKEVIAAPKVKKEVIAAPEVKKEVKAAPKTKTAKKLSKTAIKQNIVYGIQAALKSKGFGPGKLDGKMGPNTAAALKAFQSSRGLPVGVLSKDTFRALGLVR